MPAQELKLSLDVGGHGRFEAKEGPDQVWVLERSWSGVGDGLLRREWIRGAGNGWELAKRELQVSRESGGPSGVGTCGEVGLAWVLTD